MGLVDLITPPSEDEMEVLLDVMDSDRGVLQIALTHELLADLTDDDDEDPLEDDAFRAFLVRRAEKLLLAEPRRVSEGGRIHLTHQDFDLWPDLD